MAKFKGFNNQQTHQLLSELGYTGPAQQDEMDDFLAATPSAASMLGRYTEMARQRIEGQPIAPTGMAPGGPTPDYATYFGDQGEVKNIEVEKAKEAGQTELSPEVEAQTQNILKMATGQTDPNLEFDFNKDGQITSADALQFATDAKTKGDAERAKQAEIGSLTARLQELQGLPIKDDPIEDGPVDPELFLPKQPIVDERDDVERPIIQPGAPDPKDVPAEVAELDTAQKAYADAQKTLTDAQIALNDIDVEAIEFESFDAVDDTGQPKYPDALKTIQDDFLSETANDKYDIDLDTYHSDGVGRSGIMSADVKAILESGKLPADPTKYDEEELNKGSSDNWTFKYDNGQTVVIRINSKENAISRFNKLSEMLGDFKDTDTFKDKPKSESEQELQNK